MLRGSFRFALIAGAACFAMASVHAEEREAPPEVQWNLEAPPHESELPLSTDCSPPNCTWIRGEALLWWTNGAKTPPLLATGTVGDPNTEVLFGDDPIGAGLRGGIRLRMGRWLDCEQTCGWEASVFWLGNDGSGLTAGSADGSASVVRPFIDAETGVPSGQLVSSPGVIAGFTAVNTSSNMVGVDLLRRCNLCCDCCDGCDCSRTCMRRDFLLGFRYLHFSDRVTITENLTPLDPIFVPGTQIDITDGFRSNNNFYGLKLGLALERYRGPWSLEARPQVSLGLLDRRTSIRGQSTFAVPGLPAEQFDAGFYALSSNIGDYSSIRFAVVPELDLHLGYLIRPNLRLLIGYSLIFIPNVQRAGEQIDPMINSQLLPPVTPPVTGPQSPAFPDRDSNLWVQGLNLGLDWQF